MIFNSCSLSIPSGFFNAANLESQSSTAIRSGSYSEICCLTRFTDVVLT